MSQSHQPNSYQTRPTRGGSTSYLNESYRCQKCHLDGHVTERCPNLPKTEKREMGPVYPAYGHAPPTQLQRSYRLNGDGAAIQAWIAPPTSYLSAHQSRQGPLRTRHSAQTYQSSYMVPDAEFPSLAGTSLVGSLLNSPLSVNPSMTFVASPFPTQLSPIPKSVPALLTNTATHGQSHNMQESELEILPTAKGTVTFEEMSFFEQAMWNSEYDYLLMPSSTD